MEFKNIVFVPKLTWVHKLMHDSGLDEKGLLKMLRIEYPNDADNILESYKQQNKSVEFIAKNVPCRVIYREGFNAEVANQADLVIAGGGDDSTKYISHYIHTTPLLAINTDPGRSRGEMLEDDVEEVVQKLFSGQYEIREQTRIECIVEGKRTFLGMSNFVVKHVENACGNFRHYLAFQAKGSPEPDRSDYVQHKTTDALHVHTYLGITDWSNGAGRYLNDGFPVFVATEKKIGWIVQAPQELYGVAPDIIIKDPNGLLPDRIKPGIPLESGKYGMLAGVIAEDDKLHLICSKDDCGAFPDAVDKHKVDVHRGYKVVFKVADQPLRQVKMV